MTNNIKQDLIDKISSTEDENLLLLLKTDYEYFTQNEGKDVTDELSEEDKQELINLANEPFGYETISQQELDEFVKRVEDKNLTKLNVHMISSANYELKEDEKVDKGFTLLN